MTRGLNQDAQISFSPKSIEYLPGGKITFTRSGYSKYALRFAKAGIDIAQIDTAEDLGRACDDSRWVLIDEIRGLIWTEDELKHVVRLILS